MMGELCTTCQINVYFNKAVMNAVTDEEVIEWHVFQRVKEGCRECGNNNFGYNAGVNYENNLKWYIIQVSCDSCKSQYEEIMEVRIIDEPKENDESE
jgi:hypothetical protein